MDMTFFSQMNYVAVAVASLVFFVIGALWFSVLFGKIWAKEVQRHGVVIKQPSSGDMLIKLLLTIIANTIACFAIAKLVIMTGSTTFFSGLVLGIIAAVGFSATTLASVSVWENRSLKLFLLDIGYPACGIIAAAIILSLW